jgi:hypothetical protein
MSGYATFVHMSPHYFQAAFAAMPPTVHVDYEAPSFAEGLAIQAQIFNNQPFVSERPLQAYLNHHPHLSPALKYLDRSHHWLDAGAGHAVAMRDLAQQKTSRLARKFGHQAPTMTALSLGKPQCPQLDRDLKKFTQLRYTESCITDDSCHGLKPNSIDLITDIMGPLTYALDLRAILMKYGALMTHGAELFATMQVGYRKRSEIVDPVSGLIDYPETHFRNLIILDSDGNELDLKAFFQMVTGFVLYRFHQEYFMGDPQNAHFCLLRNDDPLYVPKLRFIEDRFIPGTPPRRVFQLVSPEANS